MSTPKTLIAAVSAAALALAGCGSSALDTSTAADVAWANVHLSTFCVHKLQGDEIAQADYTDRSNGIDTLIATYRDHPSATYDGKSMRDVLIDRANALQNCDADAAEQLDNVTH